MSPELLTVNASPADELPACVANERPGVSIVICCHNAGNRLPETLKHVAGQRVSQEIRWEVVVIDNASTDDTARVAIDCWPRDFKPTIRVVSEPRLGLSYARRRAFLEARYELVSFVDDDNWLYPDWVELVAQTMSRHPEVGMCGGSSEAVYETNPPAWFAKNHRSFAIGHQAVSAGYTLPTQLWGAGLCIRKSAWAQLEMAGFQPLLVDRQGANVSSGGDTEICAALGLAGWRSWYEPRLRLKHFIPASRLTWAYVRKLYRGFGNASIAQIAYAIVLRGKPTTIRERIRQTWLWNMQTALRNLFRCRSKFILALQDLGQGDQNVLELNFQIEHILQLLNVFKYYTTVLAIRRLSKKLTHIKSR